jgi:diaminopropionate ammonia-lyase family
MIGHGDSEAPSRRKPYLNPAARHWVSQPSAIDEIKTFHQRFPLYTPTSLISLPSIAKEIGVGTVYVQDESQRCGLPSFKILGASWAIFRAIAAYTKLPVSADLKTLTVAAQNAGILLVAATDGNHGRAVARVASLLGLKSRILVPQDLDVHAIELIRGEGAEVIVAEDDYDNTVLRAKAIAEEVDAAILVQDTDLIDYEEIPQVNTYTSSVTD